MTINNIPSLALDPTMGGEPTQRWTDDQIVAALTCEVEQGNLRLLRAPDGSLLRDEDGDYYYDFTCQGDLFL